MSADKFVFRFLAEQGELFAVDFAAVFFEQSKADGNFNGGRGTQSSAQRNIAGDVNVCSGKRFSRLPKRPSDSERIVGPVLLCQGRQGIEGFLDGFMEIFGVDDQLAVGARSNRGPTIEFNGGGQNETIVVVGVLADEIHAAGSAVDVGGGPKTGLERINKL